MKDACCISRVLIHETGAGKLLRNRGACQIVTPQIADEWMTERLAQIGPDCNRQADSLEMIGSEHCDGLDN